MLPPEIAPFADHHIEKLQNLKDNTQDPSTIEVLDGAIRALYRFKMCMIDEVKNKERYCKLYREQWYKNPQPTETLPFS